MNDHIAKGQEFEKKAGKKITGWALFRPQYEDAAELYKKSANSFKLAKSWDRAGLVFIKLSHEDSKREAADAHVAAGHCYKKISSKGAISCLDQAVNIYTEIDRHYMSAKYSEEIGDLYELDQDMENAITYFEKSADFYEYLDVSSTANHCKLKVAQSSAQLQQGCQTVDEQFNLLKYGVRCHLLNAGNCQLCRGDIAAITNSLKRYQDKDLTFSRTRESRLLPDLISAIDEEDVGKFTAIVKKFDSIFPPDPRKTTLLLRVKESPEAKGIEEDDLT